jgi:hypothetical protein
LFEFVQDDIELCVAPTGGPAAPAAVMAAPDRAEDKPGRAS